MATLELEKFIYSSSITLFFKGGEGEPIPADIADTGLTERDTHTHMGRSPM